MKLSAVVPLYNESSSLPALHDRLVPALQKLTDDYEIIYVDDGSNDSTADLALGLHRGDRRVKLLSFSRNFGHQMALTAGMDHTPPSIVEIWGGTPGSEPAFYTRTNSLCQEISPRVKDCPILNVVPPVLMRSSDNPKDQFVFARRTII